MLHITTGNQLDVVCDYDQEGVKVLKGLLWKLETSSYLIPLPNPMGLVTILLEQIKECEKSQREKALRDARQVLGYKEFA